VHRAYARKAQFVLPALEDFARNAQDDKIIHLDLTKGADQKRPQKPASTPSPALSQDAAAPV